MDCQQIRATIHDLLDRWERGEINAETVWYAAEDLWDAIDEELVYLPNDHPDSPTIEVLHDLSILNHQLIIQDDIPALRNFLRADIKNIEAAWENYHDYLNSIASTARRELLRDDDVYSPHQLTIPEKPQP